MKQNVYVAFYHLMKLLGDLLRRYVSILKRKDLEEQLKQKISHIYISSFLFVCFGTSAFIPPQWAMASSFTRFLDHT